MTKRASLALAVLLLTGACRHAGDQERGQAIGAADPLARDKALYAAELAFAGAVATAEAAADQGWLTGAAGRRAAALIGQAHRTLIVARMGGPDWPAQARHVVALASSIKTAVREQPR
ncbi:hypothetical protein [uncultured Sphingomonas sp.]|uniref:hypothetical protein n=1 Tax=uncultured Sphingomonas sp. TaxID=158754 RepID=UPI0025CFFA59|nr:hypothetical protein [uncultured Sphingomonas sp.]